MRIASKLYPLTIGKLYGFIWRVKCVLRGGHVWDFAESEAGFVICFNCLTIRAIEAGETL